MCEFVPPELQIEILCRLPVRSLVQFTTVCKSWHSLITSPNFITKHLNQTISTHQTPLLILRHSTTPYPSRTHKEHHLSLHVDNTTLDQYANLHVPPNCQGHSNFRVTGICNGLLCLSADKMGRNQIMSLWNPSLQKSLDIPEQIIVRKSHPHCVNHPIGFGYDPIKHDYKIVRLTYLLKSGTIMTPLTPPYVQVFELSTGSWKQVNTGVDFPYGVSIRVQSIFLNGFVHWTGYQVRKNDSDFSCLIVRFDMRNNTLDVLMEPPDYVRKYQYSRMRLGIFGNLLSFLDFDDASSWCLWVMKQYGVVSSWTKQFNIVLGNDISRVVCFRQNGDILCERNRRWYYRGQMLACYSSQSNIIKDLDIFGSGGSFYLDTYIESLALLES